MIFKSVQFRLNSKAFAHEAWGLTQSGEKINFTVFRCTFIGLVRWSCPFKRFLDEWKGEMLHKFTKGELVPIPNKDTWHFSFKELEKLFGLLFAQNNYSPPSPAQGQTRRCYKEGTFLTAEDAP